MAADYDFRRKPNENGDGEIQPLYPRIVSKGTIDSKQLFREIAEASSFYGGGFSWYHGISPRESFLLFK